jgi:hypothetical protein
MHTINLFAYLQLVFFSSILSPKFLQLPLSRDDESFVQLFSQYVYSGYYTNKLLTAIIFYHWYQFNLLFKIKTRDNISAVDFFADMET